MTKQNDTSQLGAIAVIYCHVSDTKQKTDGDGLNSQEVRCREYAQRKDYEVAAVFHDDITGKASVRPAFESMRLCTQEPRANPGCHH